MFGSEFRLNESSTFCAVEQGVVSFDLGHRSAHQRWIAKAQRAGGRSWMPIVRLLIRGVGPAPLPLPPNRLNSGLPVTVTLVTWGPASSS